MRILQIMAGASHGGAEDFFMRLVCALKKRDIMQEVIIRHDEKRRHEFVSHQIPCLEMDFPRHFRFFARRKIQQHINRFRPSIVMTWMSRASDQCPKGSFVHVGRLGGYYDLKYYKNCDYLIGNTNDLVTYFCEQGWPEKYTQYLPNFPKAVDEKVHPLERSLFDTPEDVPLLLTMGRFHDDKAFDILIRAMKQIPKAYLWIAGHGEKEESLKSLAIAEGVESRIRLLPWHDNISALYKACDLYICPSRVEPLGNVVLESWAHKRAVIAARSDGPRSLITHGENGMLSDIDDVEGLSHNINMCLEKPALAETLVKKAYETYETYFTEEKIVDAYLAFFKKIMFKKRP